MTRDDITRLALEADPFGEDGWLYSMAHNSPGTLERFIDLATSARERRADMQQRADALAQTIIALRCVVTDDTETKSDFIARVKAILADCPDTRVLQAVLDEREACARLLEDFERFGDTRDCVAAIRARGEK